MCCSLSREANPNLLPLVKPHTKMGKIFSAYANKKGVREDAYRFLFDGERIGAEATPQSLGLEEGDTVWRRSISLQSKKFLPLFHFPLLQVDAFIAQEGGVTGSGGKVRMPHNNRVSSSAAMKMTSIWTNVIKYDPYAAEGEPAPGAAAESAESAERTKGIMQLAKISSAEQGTSDRSTDFARQVFWGLKRKAPPQGYTEQLLSDGGGSDSDDSSDSSSDSEDERRAKKAAARKRSLSPEARPERGDGGGAAAEDDERRAKKHKKKEKKERRSKKHKKEKKEKKHKHKKEKKSKKSSRSDSD